MNRQALTELQQAILRRIVADDDPYKPEIFMFGSQHNLTLHYFSKHTAAMIGFGIHDHRRAYEFISAMQNFYDAITPEELAILNMNTIKCPCCESDLTLDEFYEIKSTPGSLGLETNTSNEHGILSRWCKSCTYKVPVVDAFRKHRPGYVYLAECDDMYKIGRTRDIIQRENSLKHEYSHFALLHYIQVQDTYAVEARLHSVFLHRHEHNEIFCLSIEDVGHIMSLAGGA